MTVVELYKKTYPAKLFYISHTQGIRENNLGSEVQELLDYLGPVVDYKDVDEIASFRLAVIEDDLPSLGESFDMSADKYFPTIDNHGLSNFFKRLLNNK